MDQANNLSKIDKLFRVAFFMGIIGGSLYIVSLFMEAFTAIVPFYGTLTFKMSQYMDKLTIVILIIGGAAIASSFFRYAIVQIVSGSIGLIFGIISYAGINDKLDIDETYISVSIGVGPYILLLGSGLIIAAGIVCEYAKIKQKHMPTEETSSEGRSQTKPEVIFSMFVEKIKSHKEDIKKWTIRILKIAVPVVGAIGVIVLCVYIFNTVIPRSHYNKGQTAYEAADYSTAVQEFTKARDYEDAPDMLSASEIRLHYQNGVNAFSAGDFNTANAEFLAAGDYEDSEEQAALSELGMHYTSGVSLLENDEYEAAISEFEAAGDFEDASDKIYEAYYGLASSQYESGDYLSAAENYSLTNGYSDSEDMIISLGDDCVNNGDYETAASYYQYSSDERYLSYAQAMLAVNNGDYMAAIDNFSDAGDLFDSAERVNEYRYAYGLQQLVSGDYSAATAYLQLVTDNNDANIAFLIASAENANQNRDIVTAVNSYMQVPEDYSIDGFDVQGRRAIFTGEEAMAFAEFCGEYEVESNDCSCENQGRYFSYGGWELTDIMDGQSLSFNCKYDNGTFTLNGHIVFFIFTEYSSLRDYNEYEFDSRNFTFENITDLPTSYEFDDGTTLTFSGDSATVHYHKVDNYMSGANYIYDSRVTYVRVG